MTKTKRLNTTKFVVFFPLYRTKDFLVRTP